MNPELHEWPRSPWERWADRWFPRFVLASVLAVCACTLVQAFA